MWNQMKTIVLLGTLSAFVTGAVSLLAPGYWMPFAAVAVGLNLVMYYYSDRMVLRMQKATELNGADQPALSRPRPRRHRRDAGPARQRDTAGDPRRHGACAS